MKIYLLQVLEIVQHYCSTRTQELPPYDTHTHQGFLKHLVIRSGRYTLCCLLLAVFWVFMSHLYQERKQHKDLKNSVESYFQQIIFSNSLMIDWYREPETGDIQLMVNFVTSAYKPMLLQPLVNELVTGVHDVVSSKSWCVHVFLHHFHKCGIYPENHLYMSTSFWMM